MYYYYYYLLHYSGLGYIVGSGIANLTRHWQWALRVRPLSHHIIAYYRSI